LNRCLLNRQTVSIQSLRHCKKHSVGVPAPVHPAEVLETRLRLESSVRFSRLKAIPRVIHAPKARAEAWQNTLRRWELFAVQQISISAKRR